LERPKAGFAEPVVYSFVDYLAMENYDFLSGDANSRAFGFMPVN
jgi:hypothetical protein